VDAEGNECFKNYMRTRQSPQVEAKSRLRYLPTEVENPTFQKVLDAHARSLEEIEKYKAAQADEQQSEPEAEKPQASAMFTPPTSQD
jgi:hypothetical protein